MPKILILFAGQPTAMVDAVADGARSVRFSEVELRRVDKLDDAEGGTLAGSHQTLAGVEEIVPYDAVVVSASEGGGVPSDLAQLLERAAASTPRSAWQNKVGAAFASEAKPDQLDLWPALRTLGDAGMLLIAPHAATTDAAKELGARVAQVVGWMTHARSHHHHAH